MWLRVFVFALVARFVPAFIEITATCHLEAAPFALDHMQTADVSGDPSLLGFLLRFHGSHGYHRARSTVVRRDRNNSGLIITGSCSQQARKLLAQRGWLQHFQPWTKAKDPVSQLSGTPHGHRQDRLAVAPFGELLGGMNGARAQVGFGLGVVNQNLNLYWFIFKDDSEGALGIAVWAGSWADK